jgi:hypothetical protein
VNVIRKLIPIGLCAAASLSGQPAHRTQEETLITRIRAVAAQNLARLPDYTCLQTVERFEQSGPARPFDLVDRIRLEVALVGGKELFTWPGSGEFDDRGISEIVGRGAIGSGSFALQARNIFVHENAATFEWAGEVAEGGQRLIRYRYSVPKDRSRRVLRVGDDREVVAFHGSFDVDGATLDLARLEVRAAGIPATSAVQSMSEEIRYAVVRIGSSGFLLPQMSELVMIYASGEATRNVTRFTACRQYTGEARIRFDEPRELEAAAMLAVTPTRTVDLEVGALIQVRLESTVRFESAATGDIVPARLATELKRGRRVVAPKGAPADVRLTRLEKRRFLRGSGASARFVDGLIAGMQLTAIELPGTQIPVSAVIAEVRRLPWRVYLGRIDGPGEITFAVQGLELPRGMLMVWRVRE